MQCSRYRFCIVPDAAGSSCFLWKKFKEIHSALWRLSGEWQTVLADVLEERGKQDRVEELKTPPRWTSTSADDSVTQKNAKGRLCCGVTEISEKIFNMFPLIRYFLGSDLKG